MSEVLATTAVVVSRVRLYRAYRQDGHSAEARAWQLLELFDGNAALAAQVLALMSHEGKQSELSRLLGGGGMIPHVTATLELLLQIHEGPTPTREDEVEELKRMAREVHPDSTHDMLFYASRECEDPYVLAGIANLYKTSSASAMAWLRHCGQTAKREEARQEALRILARFC